MLLSGVSAGFGVGECIHCILDILLHQNLEVGIFCVYGFFLFCYVSSFSGDFYEEI